MPDLKIWTEALLRWRKVWNLFLKVYDVCKKNIQNSVNEIEIWKKKIHNYMHIYKKHLGGTRESQAENK